MRRMLFGLLTFGACATNAAALAEELSAMDDFFTSPLRKTLDPQVEIFPLALEDRRFDPRANAGGAAVIAAAPVDSTIFDRIGLRDGPVDPQAARPTAEFATTDFVGPPFWASDQINIVGRKPNLEQAPKKLIDFFDKSLLQHFDFERFLIVRTIPFERKAL